MNQIRISNIFKANQKKKNFQQNLITQKTKLWYYKCLTKHGSVR